MVSSLETVHKLVGTQGELQGVMQVSVLVILYRGRERITVHDDSDKAWSELVNFVDAFWKNSDVAVLTSTPASEEQRVKLFFSETGASYILGHADVSALDRKSTRLNSSHVKISYAVFCLKKKKTIDTPS